MFLSLKVNFFQPLLFLTTTKISKKNDTIIADVTLVLYDQDQIQAL